MALVFSVMAMTHGVSFIQFDDHDTWRTFTISRPLRMVFVLFADHGTWHYFPL